MFQMKLFGFFRMTRRGQVLDEGSIHSTILIKLLVYMVLHRDRVLTNIELEKQLWKPQEIDNPADALKNLMYRLRKALNASFGEGDYILTGRGNYRWNPAYEVELDTEVFEQAYVKVKENTVDEVDEIEKIHCVEKAVDIYKGRFLVNMENDYWVSNQSMLYHSRYLYLVEMLLKYHWKQEQFETVEMICSNALEIDEYEETLNLYKIRALVRQGKDSQAEKFFYTLEHNIKNGLGIKGASLIRSMKRELRMEEKANQLSRQEIQKMLSERAFSLEKKAVMCDFEEFKFQYALQAKRNKRRQEEGYVIVLTVELDADSDVSVDNVEDYLMQFAMESVGKVLEKSLRDFDIVSKCSNCQYIIMLDHCSYNNSISVAQRILKKYENVASSHFVKLHLDIQKIATEVD